MLTCYELYDLHAVLVSIRAYPLYSLHEPVLDAVLDVLARQDRCHDLNQFRTAIAPLLSMDKSGLYAFCRVANIYTYFPEPPLKKTPHTGF